MNVILCDWIVCRAPSTEALEPVPSEHPRSAEGTADQELGLEGAAAVNRRVEAHREEPVTALVAEQPVAVPMSPLGGLHEVGDPGAQPVSSAKAVACTNTEVLGGPSPVELGCAIERFGRTEHFGAAKEYGWERGAVATSAAADPSTSGNNVGN